MSKTLGHAGHDTRQDDVQNNFHIQIIIDEIRRLSIAFTNHSEADRTDFTRLMEKIESTQEKFALLMGESIATRKLIKICFGIAGSFGAAFLAIVVAVVKSIANGG